MISELHHEVVLTRFINPAQSEHSNELAWNFSLKCMQQNHKKTLESLKDAFIIARARTTATTTKFKEKKIWSVK